MAIDAIGAVLYHLIAAIPPYHDTPWEKLLAAIAEGPPVPLHKLVPTISAAASPCAHVTRDAFERIMKEMVDGIANARLFPDSRVYPNGCPCRYF